MSRCQCAGLSASLRRILRDMVGREPIVRCRQHHPDAVSCPTVTILLSDRRRRDLPETILAGTPNDDNLVRANRRRAAQRPACHRLGVPASMVCGGRAPSSKAGSDSRAAHRHLGVLATFHVTVCGSARPCHGSIRRSDAERPAALATVTFIESLATRAGAVITYSQAELHRPVSVAAISRTCGVIQNIRGLGNVGMGCWLAAMSARSARKAVVGVRRRGRS